MINTLYTVTLAQIVRNGMFCFTVVFSELILTDGPQDAKFIGYRICKYSDYCRHSGFGRVIRKIARYDSLLMMIKVYRLPLPWPWLLQRSG
jgi:hypothetical protein